MIFKDYLLRFLKQFAGRETALVLAGGVSIGVFVIPRDSESYIADLQSRCGVAGNLWDYEGTVISNPTDSNDEISITIIPSKTEERAGVVVEELMKDKDVLAVKGYWDMFFTGLPNERVFKANRLVAEYGNIKFYNGKITLPDVDEENVSKTKTSLTTNPVVELSKIDGVNTGIRNHRSYLCTMEVGSKIFKGYIDNTPCGYGFFPDANAKENLCRCLSVVWQYLLSAKADKSDFSKFLTEGKYDIIPYILGLDYFLLIKGDVEDYCVVFPKEEVLETSKAILTFLGVKRVVDLTYYKIVKTGDNSSKVIVDINTKVSAAAALMGNTVTDNVSVIVTRQPGVNQDFTYNYTVLPSRVSSCEELINALITNATGDVGSVINVSITCEGEERIFGGIWSMKDVDIPANWACRRVSDISGLGGNGSVTYYIKL